MKACGDDILCAATVTISDILLSMTRSPVHCKRDQLTQSYHEKVTSKILIAEQEPILNLLRNVLNK